MRTSRGWDRFCGEALIDKLFALWRVLRGGQTPGTGRRRCRPLLEALEDRTTPAAVLGASMTDVLILDADADTQADPGDQVRYTVTVRNTGDADAANTALAITLDPNAPEPGANNSTLRIGPLAFRDSYNAV